MPLERRLNHGRSWSDEDVRVLRSMLVENASVPNIARLLGRSQEAVSSKAREFKKP